MKPYGGNYRILDKYVSLYGIDTSHFLGQGWNVNNSPSDIKPIEKYLNNEIPITSYKLKKRLLKEGLKKQKCEICNLSEWNDSIIPLELHHINGNNKCYGHTECDAIIMDSGKVEAVPSLAANNIDASLIHEAAIGKIAGEQLIKLMTLGLTEKEAEEQIINGFLK